MWTPSFPDCPVRLTPGERFPVDLFWLSVAGMWFWNRCRANRFAKSPAHGRVTDKPTYGRGDWLRVRLWISWPNFVGRVFFAALITIGLYSSLADLISMLPIVR
jgi:hypothetical protein